MLCAVEWLESLSPWPEEFGLGRIQALLRALGDPQRDYPAVHVVGTNGKSTTTRMVEALLAADGLHVGAYLSPHVRGWSERIRIGGSEVDIEQALAFVRTPAERVQATQFEVLTAAALAAFSSDGVDVAVVEAGLGGRLDATNVLEAPVVVLTNVALEHTDVLGATREEIAAEKLAVVRPGATVVLGEPEWAELARRSGAGEVVVVSRSNVGLAVAAAEAFVGRPLDAAVLRGVQLAGRLERRGEEPLEIWDGAHNLAGVGYMLARVPSRRYAVVASILTGKDVPGMLAALSVLGDQLVATASSHPLAVPAAELARAAAPFFPVVEAVEPPTSALARARELAGPRGAVLATGSLYLLADLTAASEAAGAGLLDRY